MGTLNSGSLLLRLQCGGVGVSRPWERPVASLSPSPLAGVVGAIGVCLQCVAVGVNSALQCDGVGVHSALECDGLGLTVALHGLTRTIPKGGNAVLETP